MKITYDKDADAMYIYLNDKEVDKTVKVSSKILVDLDVDGNLRGIEVLFVSKALADTDFSHIYLQLPKVGDVDLHLPVGAIG
ncbi:MAG: DUF2283 domain-containing protein [bacterium]|nr:DUF2283 domain-containing protein [bacterium]